jgi:hypothetical protein
MTFNRSTMMNDKDKGEAGSARPGKNPRQDRLKRALRENLKRRKSQARGRDDTAIVSSNADGVGSRDGGAKSPGK